MLGFLLAALFSAQSAAYEYMRGWNDCAEGRPMDLRRAGMAPEYEDGYTDCKARVRGE